MWRHVYAIQNLTQTGSDATVTDSLRFGIYVWSSNRSYLLRCIWSYYQVWDVNDIFSRVISDALLINARPPANLSPPRCSWLCIINKQVLEIARGTADPHIDPIPAPEDHGLVYLALGYGVWGVFFQRQDFIFATIKTCKKQQTLLFNSTSQADI